MEKSLTKKNKDNWNFIIPTMDDWFELARENRDYLTYSFTLLKDYGTMKCMSFIDEHFSRNGKDIRILEIGHGFSPAVMQRFQSKHEMWGIDENQGLHYFDSDKWEENYQEIVVNSCPEVKLVRGLVGSAEYPADLPHGYFDVIYSISILEELPDSMLQNVIRAVSELLRPGGWFIGTHDLKGCFLPDRLKMYFDIHKECGLNLGEIPDPANLKINWEYSLLEHPAMVMLTYQQETPEKTRTYEGHWTTMFTAAQKQSLQQQNDFLQQQNDFLQQQNESLQQQNESLQQHITAMESSKFWKLRTLWFKVKSLLFMTQRDLQK